MDLGVVGPGGSSGRKGQKCKLGKIRYLKNAGLCEEGKKVALKLSECRLNKVEDAVEKSERRRCGDERLHGERRWWVDLETSCGQKQDTEYLCCKPHQNGAGVSPQQ